MAVLAPTPQKNILEMIPTWLPIGIVIFSLIAFGVRADSQIRGLDDKVTNYDRLVIDRTDRMARMETQLKNLEKGQDRMEALLIAQQQRN